LKTATPEPPQAAAVATAPTPQAQAAQLPQPIAASNENVRSERKLPSIQELLNQLTPTVSESRTAPDVDLGPRPSVVVTPPPKPEPTPEAKPGETPAKVETRDAAKPAPVAAKPVSIPGSTTYTVVDGDNLASIAKKVYGPDEGNRVVNIQRIFQTNQTGMKSANQLSIGQKLVIPPLPAPTATTATPAAATTPSPKPNPGKPANVLPPSLFERVESLSKPIPAIMMTPASEGRWYTVQDGDKLWKIAATQLGAGSRWDEIYKLNTDVITNQDALKVGTRLRLPVK
jgi:nucleoid-associated protein YgaU